MRYEPIFKFIILLISLLMILPAIAGPDNESKVPVTTSSKKALQYFMKGRDLQESLQGQESIQYFEKAVSEDPDFALAYIYLSLVTPRPEDFFKIYQQAVEKMDKVSIGEQLWIQGFDAGVKAFSMKQREYYSKLVNMYPQDERALTLLGNHFFGLQDYQRAAELYQKAIKINPDFSQPYNQLGYAQRFLGNYDESEKAFQKYIDLIPDDPNPYDSYAELQMKMGNYDKSIKYYKRALIYNPNFVASHIGIATNLNYKGDHSAAREQLKKLSQIARNDAEKRAAHFAMAVSYADEGRMEDAITEIEKQFNIAKATNDVPAMAGDHVIIGNLYLEIGQSEDAIRHFEEAVKIAKASDLSEKVKDNFQRAYLYNITRAALRKNDLKTANAKAKEHLKMSEAVENPFQMKLSHELMGMIALAEQDYDDAVEEFQESNLQNPYNLYRLSVAYGGLGDKPKAKDYHDRALDYNALNNMNYAFVRNRITK